MQFAFTQWFSRSLLPLCTTRQDYFLATSIFQNKWSWWHGVFGIVPCGGLRNLERFHRSKFLSRRIRYSSNASCAFSPAVYKILHSGDVEINPCWFVRVENEEHDKNRTKQHGFIREPLLREHMVRSEGSWELETYFIYATIYSTRPRSSKLKVFYTNARSIVNKNVGKIVGETRGLWTVYNTITLIESSGSEREVHLADFRLVST